MQPAIITTEHKPNRPARPARNISAAPIVVPASAASRYSEAVFGKVPAGFKLQNQTIQQLAFWHEKATRLSFEFVEKYGGPTADNSSHYDALYDAQWNTLDAALAADLKSGRDVALVLGMIARHAEDKREVDWLKLEDLKQFASKAKKATAALRPMKIVGPSSKGKRLTRTGLLERYQTFLIKELMTLSYELYGQPEYALNVVVEDDAVNARCRRRPDPFFDQRKLSSRARRVLGSLRIDTVKTNDRNG